MASNYKEQYLEHYGVKGMRWGIRRTPEQLGYHEKSTKNQKKAIDDYNSGMTDSQFKKKYGMSRKKFSKQTKKYVNPIHKKSANPGTNAYANQSTNVALYGRRGTNRINKRIANGQKENVAKRKEFATQIAVGTLAAAAYTYSPYIKQSLSVIGKATLNSVKKATRQKGMNKVLALESQLVWDVSSKKWIYI